MACTAEQLVGIALFEHLSDAERMELAHFIDLRSLQAGQTLFHAGQPGDAMYVVKSCLLYTSPSPRD